MDTQAQVRDIMIENLWMVDVDDDLHHVHDLMKKHSIRHVPVVRNGKLMGIISRTDILRLSFGNIFEGEGETDVPIFDMLKLEQVMVSNPKTVKPQCTITELAKLFVESDFHALPVVNDEGEAIGIVTTTDVIAYFMRNV